MTEKTLDQYQQDKQEEKSKKKKSTTQIYFSRLADRLNDKSNQVDEIFNIKPRRFAKILLLVTSYFVDHNLPKTLKFLLGTKELNADEKILAIFLLGVQCGIQGINKSEH